MDLRTLVYATIGNEDPCFRMYIAVAAKNWGPDSRLPTPDFRRPPTPDSRLPLTYRFKFADV
jgi:hypothetical protein